MKRSGVVRYRRPTLRLPGTFVVALEGCAIGIAGWCTLFLLEVLPSKLADSPGMMLAAALGLLAGAIGQRRVLIVGLELVGLAALFVGVTPISQMVAAHWIRNEPLRSGVAAVVVLSAGLNPDTTISSEAADHLLMGLEVIRGGKSHLLVTTTTRDAFPTGFVSGEVDQARIIDLFDSAVAWMRTPPGHTTRDEAVASAKLLLPNGIQHIAVITSPMHTRRACAVFEAVGFSVTCIAARLRSPGGFPLSPGPTDRFAIFGQWVYEVAAMAEYSMRGWLPHPGAR